MHPANMPTKMRTTLFLRSVSVCLRTLHQHKLAPVSTEGGLLVCTRCICVLPDLALDITVVGLTRALAIALATCCTPSVAVQF